MNTSYKRFDHNVIFVFGNTINLEFIVTHVIATCQPRGLNFSYVLATIKMLQQCSGHALAIPSCLVANHKGHKLLATFWLRFGDVLATAFAGAMIC